jgi:hypothetical protein
VLWWNRISHEARRVSIDGRSDLRMNIYQIRDDRFGGRPAAGAFAAYPPFLPVGAADGQTIFLAARTGQIVVDRQRFEFDGRAVFRIEGSNLADDPGRPGSCSGLSGTRRRHAVTADRNRVRFRAKSEARQNAQLVGAVIAVKIA